MTARWPAMKLPAGSQIDLPGNDSRHNLVDDNRGGSPRGGTGTKNVAVAQRGGFGQQGRDKVVMPAKMGAGRGGSGNPAARAGNVGNFQPDARIPGHGGSAQTGKTGLRNNFAGAFGGPSGQKGLPSGPHANPKPSMGNTSGLAYRRIAGRFKRAAMGAKPTGSGGAGKYGSAPVTSNT